MLRSESKRFKPDWIDWKIFIPMGVFWSAFLFIIAGIEWLDFLNSEHANLSLISFRLPDVNYGFILLLACVTAGGVAAVLHPMMFWTALAMMVGAVFLLALSFYQYDGVKISWLVHGLGVFLTGVSVFCIKEMKRRDMLVRMRSSLERVVSKKSLLFLEKDPQYLDIRDRQVPASIVAVELVGFVDMLSGHSQDAVSNRFRLVYNELTKTVHSLGGLVLPGYHGRFLCAFGDSLIEGSPVLKHAERALQSAMQLQRDQALRIRMQSGRSEPVLTMKIGVASARCFISNIGSLENIEFGLFGTAVDEATHLATHADMGGILFSRMTRDLLVGVNPESSPFHQKLINPVSGAEEMIPVFSFDPLYDNAVLRGEVFNVIRDAANYERKDIRHPIKDASRIQISTNVGSGHILNISQGGVGLKLPAAVAIGSSLRVKVIGGDDILMQRLKNRDLTSFGVEVRWSSGSGTDFVHGLVYKTMRNEDREFLLQCILETQPQSSKRRTG